MFIELLNQTVVNHFLFLEAVGVSERADKITQINPPGWESNQNQTGSNPKFVSIRKIRVKVRG